MSSTNFPDVPNAALRGFFDAVTSSIRRNGGGFPDAPPNAFKDRLQTTVPVTGPGAGRTPNPAREVLIEIRSNPDGNSATAKVRPLGPAAVNSIEGQLDISRFLTVLQGELGYSVGTATLVASTVTVTLPIDNEGNPQVPAGSTVIAMVETPGGNVKQLSAVRDDDTHITISSGGDGYAALLESAGVSDTLVAGTKDLTLANAAGDRLSVVKTADGGTPGDLYTVVRKSDTEVTVKSWTIPVASSATALVAGTKDIALVNAVGDKLTVRETASGGTAADHFSVKRKSGTEVTVQAHDSAGDFVDSNTSTVIVTNDGPATSADTSTVKVYNFGQKAHETSTVTYAVIRP